MREREHLGLIVFDVGDLRGEELQAMALLSQVMDWFEQERGRGDAPVDQETMHRIAQWFASRYGGTR